MVIMVMADLFDKMDLLMGVRMKKKTLILLIFLVFGNSSILPSPWGKYLLNPFQKTGMFKKTLARTFYSSSKNYYWFFSNKKKQESKKIKAKKFNIEKPKEKLLTLARKNVLRRLPGFAASVGWVAYVNGCAKNSVINPLFSLSGAGVSIGAWYGFWTWVQYRSNLLTAQTVHRLSQQIDDLPQNIDKHIARRHLTRCLIEQKCSPEKIEQELKILDNVKFNPEEGGWKVFVPRVEKQELQTLCEKIVELRKEQLNKIAQQK